MIRGKRPEADLKRSYGSWLGIALGASVLLHAVFLWLVPPFDFSARPRPSRPRFDLVLEQVPPTQQRRALPPPSMQLSSDRGASVPQQAVLLVEREPALELDGLVLREEEEAVEWWQVEKAPKVAHRVAPPYPELARQANLEGRVYARVLVDTAGRVRRVSSLEGHRAFHDAVRRACLQWRFHPAIQNDRPVRVWVTVPFVFELE